MIAIDGPAGAGKTTISTAVARELGVPHMDTGGMYRALALKACRSQIGPDQVDAVIELLAVTEISLDGGRIVLDGEDVSEQVRSARVTEVVSPLAAIPELRAWMVALQRRGVGERGAVVEGRDIGTVVFPDAELKVFLTASAEERARRRALEAVEPTDIDSTLASINERDRRDIERDASPLRAADDAIVIDTTGIRPGEVVGQIVRLAAALRRRTTPEQGSQS